METTQNELNLEYFFFRLPIYKVIKISEDNWKHFLALLNLGRAYSETSIEGYNPFRKVTSTFGGWSNIKVSLEYFTQYGGTDRIGIKCRRHGDFLDFFIHYNPDKHTLMKVGQYPSVADFHLHEIHKYRKVLTEEKLKEFSRANGLAASGVGIGSFVYLRRIFEHLIAATFNEHKASLSILDSDFSNNRMDEKIKILKDYLPTFLVENRKLYSILSLGVHELNEQDCLDYYDTVRVGIEVVLDEKLETLKKEAKTKTAQKNISELHNKLKNRT
jgi:hypothetical protein